MRRLGSALVVIVALLGAFVVMGSSSGTAPAYQVRAIFDDAAFAVPGEDVRIAGAPVGSISSLDVCVHHCDPVVAPRNKAAVTLSISHSGFTPFYANAHCSIRPQSLIGERFVDCVPGSSDFPALKKITSGPGAGTHLLPVTRTTSPVDSDLVQDISRQPIRQRFGLILDELGTGLAARGSDLRAVIRRADPALGYTDNVIQILARQNRQLAQLAVDSDAVLTPLAAVKRSIAGFVVNGNTTAVASAQRAADISRSFQLFPSFLRQLRPLMVDLGNLADQGTPLMASLGQAASGINRQFQNLVPFAQAATPALIELGKSSQESQPSLLATIPLANQLKNFGAQAEPAAASLDKLTGSLDNTGAIEQLMSLLFYGTSAANGFDATGHYVRAEPLVGSCTAYSKVVIPGCSANFNAAASADIGGQSAAVSRVVTQAARNVTPGHKTNGALKGLLGYLIGSGR